MGITGTFIAAAAVMIQTAVVVIMLFAVGAQRDAVDLPGNIHHRHFGHDGRDE